MRNGLRYIVWVLCFVQLSVLAQENIYRQFSIEDGLPSSEVHAIQEDASGHLWLATDRGLVRTDGKEVQVFDANYGFQNFVFLNMFEESERKFWVSNLLNEIFYFDPLEIPIQFHPYQFNDTLKATFKQFRWNEHIRNMWPDNQGGYFFTFLVSPGQIHVDDQGNSQVYNWEFYDIVNGQLGMSEVNDIILKISMDKQEITTEYRLDEDEPHDIYVQLIDEDTLWESQLDYTSVFRPFCGVADYQFAGDTLLFLLGNQLLRYSNRNLESLTLQSNGLRIRSDDHNYYIPCLQGMEVVSKDFLQQKRFLDATHVTDFHLDRAGGQWISTTSKGVLYTPNREIFSLKLTGSDLILRNIEINDDWIVCNGLEGNNWVFNKSYELLDDESEGFLISGIYTLNIGKSTMGKYLGGKMSTPIQSFEKDAIDYFSLKWGEYDSLYCNKRTVYDFKTDPVSFFFLDVPKIHDGVRMNNGQILLTTEEGLYVKGEREEAFKYETFPVVNDKMVKVDPFRDGFLISSYAHGLIYLEDQKVYFLNEQKGLLSSSVSCFEIENENTVWVGTYKGLNRVSIGEDFWDYEIAYLDRNSGLVSNEVMALEYWKDTLWVATKGGVNFFRSDMTLQQNLLSDDLFTIDSVKVDNKLQLHSDSYVFNENEKIDIYFKQVCYSSLSPVVYEFRIEGNDPQWTTISDGHIYLSNLSNGDYVLQVRSRMEQYQGGIHELHFHVELPWYRSPLAWVVYAILSLMLLVLIYKILLKRVNARRQKELEKAQLELKALISQMNPHFTFNTINSIQHYIVENDNRKALDYLSEFALLIRKSLDFSRREFITLQEEMEFLKLYVDLERRRFGKDIVLEFDLNLQGSTEDIAFPALLLQPLVENSIIHGLHGTTSDGKIEIRIEENGNHFNIWIADNGRGIQKSEAVTDGRKSHGLDILESRIKLYNSSLGKDTDLRVLSEHKFETGTTVFIKLYKFKV